jgi:hypothetical protein
LMIERVRETWLLKLHTWSAEISFKYLDLDSTYERTRYVGNMHNMHG